MADGYLPEGENESSPGWSTAKPGEAIPQQPRLHPGGVGRPSLN